MHTTEEINNVNMLDTYRTNTKREVWLVVLASLLVYLIAHRFDIIDNLIVVLKKYERYEVDELVAVVMFLVVAMTAFAIKRWKELLSTVRVLEDKNDKLEKAIEEIHVLKGIIPVCSYCKKVRNDEGYWKTLEAYIKEYSGAKMSHGICPDCMRKYFPDIKINDEELKKKGI